MSNTEAYRSIWNPRRILRLGIGYAMFILIAFPLQMPAQMEASSNQERRFDPDRLERYRNNPDYNYDRAIPETPVPPKEKDRRDLDDFPSPNIGGGAAVGALAKGLIWVLIIGVSIFVIAQLLKIRMGRLVKKDSDEAVAMTDLSDGEDINQMDFDDPIQEAINQGQFRRATRLLYLRSLKQLQNRSLIEWKREKTNHQYLRELNRPDLQPLFREITFLFEYIWYGEFPVDRNHFNTAHATFLRFDQALRRHDEK